MFALLAKPSHTEYGCHLQAPRSLIRSSVLASVARLQGQEIGARSLAVAAPALAPRPTDQGEVKLKWVLCLTVSCTEMAASFDIADACTNSCLPQLYQPVLCRRSPSQLQAPVPVAEGAERAVVGVPSTRPPGPNYDKMVLMAIQSSPN